MSRHFLIEQLQNISNARKENRQKVAVIVLNDKNLHQELLKITFDVTNELSIKAAWILEWICTHHSLLIVIENLEQFTTNLKRLSFDSAIRPCAKICEQLAITFFDKKNDLITKHLSETTKKQLIETGFDWLMTNQKTAVKAYTMHTLFLFGKEQKWIHEELKYLIKTKIIFESKGTKARGKKVLNLIEKHQKSHL
ncbi:MAG: hypothetical protein NWS05_00635 [Polaribacter sp.]|nr:hypothetical protein [Polaribacter sp.]